MRIADIKAGDMVLLDAGFTCVKAGVTKIYDDQGELYFLCAAGRHYLGGQISNDETGELIGISEVKP